MTLPTHALRGPLQAAFYLLLMGLTGVSVQNLFVLREWWILLASVFWPALLLLSLRELYASEAGWENFKRNRLRPFASQEFVELEFDEQERWLCCGYCLAGRDYQLLKVPIRGITRVGWSAGQASSRAGKDMGDWSVIVWFDPSQVVKCTASVRSLFILGESGELAVVSELGRDFLAFLAQAGLQFEPGDGDHAFLPVR